LGNIAGKINITGRGVGKLTVTMGQPLKQKLTAWRFWRRASAGLFGCNNRPHLCSKPFGFATNGRAIAIEVLAARFKVAKHLRHGCAEVGDEGQ
jgi:hypothetical protein